MTDDLVAWLTAQLDHDEAVARAATEGPWTHDPMKQWHDGEDFVNLTHGQEFVGYGGPSPFRGCIATTGEPSRKESMSNATHIALHDPARVLREIAAKRRIVAALAEAEDNHGGYITATYTTRDALKDMAAVYAGRDGYEESWKP